MTSESEPDNYQDTALNVEVLARIDRHFEAAMASALEGDFSAASYHIGFTWGELPSKLRKLVGNDPGESIERFSDSLANVRDPSNPWQQEQVSRKARKAVLAAQITIVDVLDKAHLWIDANKGKIVPIADEIPEELLPQLNKAE